ncbi:hypothetical protein VP1G_03284 [Cytospora mali]|uniref:Uncharacterized protein n=1 Tax=Cytospora mali TaxID=578113 RepID=A0A194UWD1_CYTMA|nr:hypothetical protein VP1G_03284 [Valsa mali var. pyri (nom. inval.)]
MADNTPPCSEGTPGLTPDNGSVSSSSSSPIYSFDNQWDSQWDVQIVEWDINNEPFVPRQLNLLFDHDEPDNQDRPPSPVINLNDGAEDTPRRPLMEPLTRRMNPRVIRSTGPIRPSSRSNRNTLPARGYWDTPRLIGVTEVQNGNHHSEEETEEQQLQQQQQQHLDPDEQDNPAVGQMPPHPRMQAMGTSRRLTPIDAIPALDLDSPLPHDVTPPSVSTPQASASPAPMAWYHFASARRRLARGDENSRGLPHLRVGTARFRDFWRDIWRRFRGQGQSRRGRGRERESRNRRRGSGAAG